MRQHRAWVVRTWMQPRFCCIDVANFIALSQTTAIPCVLELAVLLATAMQERFCSFCLLGCPEELAVSAATISFASEHVAFAIWCSHCARRTHDAMQLMEPMLHAVLIVSVLKVIGLLNLKFEESGCDLIWRCHLPG